MKYIKIFILILIGMNLVAHSVAEETRNFPSNLSFVLEMENFPEAEWEICYKSDYPEIEKYIYSEWGNISVEIAKLLTPELVKTLSQWSLEEMSSYNSVPSLSDIRFKLVRENKDKKELLFEGIIDTLPAHVPNILTRWLKAFVVYDVDKKAITRVVITIQGQLLE